MKIIYNTNEFMIKNEEMLAETLSNIVDDLQKNNLYFNHFIIDGEKFYGELYEYPNEFEIVQIQYLNEMEYVSQLLLDGEGYLKRATPALRELTESVYQGNLKKEIWIELGQLTEGINYIQQIIEFIGTKLKEEKWNDLLQKWYASVEFLTDMTKALEEKDTVMLGDLLQYELIPLFEETLIVIAEKIDSEGVRHDAN